MKWLRNITILVGVETVLQGCCFYLFWVSGSSWEDTPRTVMTIVCGFALIAGAGLTLDVLSRLES